MASRIPQQLPNMFAPTLDVNELEKRIADLRAVEQWLELNASILRTTIQSLEVQRATIATLKGISGAMMAPMLGRSETSPSLPREPTARSRAWACCDEGRRVELGAGGSSAGRAKKIEPACRQAIGHSIGGRCHAAESSCVVEHVAGPIHEDCERRGQQRRTQRLQKLPRKNLRRAARSAASRSALR